MAKIRDYKLEARITELEKKLAKIWADIFKIDKVEITDNFFDLGGTSLLGMLLFNQIEEELNIKIPMESLVKFSTVADMAKIITEHKEQKKKDSFSSHIALSPKEYRKMLSIIAGCKIPAIRQGSLMTGFNLNGLKNPIFWCEPNYEEHPKIVKHLIADQPVYGMFSGLGIIVTFKTKKENRLKITKRVAAHYVNEILKVKPNGPYILAGTCHGAEVATEIAFNLIDLGKKVKRLFLIEFFDEILFHYPGKTALVYSKDGSNEPYKPFIDWNEHGWEKKFVNPPKLYKIGGRHDEYYKEPYVQELAVCVKDFINN